MSNIANQVVAIVATLLGFAAHDALTERTAPAVVVADAANTAVDPVVTRSVNLEGLSADWLSETPRAERAIQARPILRVSAATIAARPDHAGADSAHALVNKARVAAPGAQADVFLR